MARINLQLGLVMSDQRVNINNILKNSAWLSAASLIPALCSIAAIPVLSRLAGVTAFGAFAGMLATATFVSAVGSQWIQQPIGVLAPGAEQRERDIIILTTATQILITSLTALTGLFIINKIQITNETNFPIVSITFTVIGLLLVGTASVWSQAVGKTKEYAIVQSLASIAKFVGPATFILISTDDATAEQMISGLGTAIAVVGILVWTRIRPYRSYLRYRSDIEQEIQKNGENSRPRFSRKLLNTMQIGLPMAPWFLLFGTITQLDKVILGLTTGNAALGIYSATFNFYSNAAILVLSPLQAAFWPAIIKRSRKSGWSRTKPFFHGCIQVAVQLGIAMVVTSWSFSQELSHLLGQDFREGTNNLIPLAVLCGFLQVFATVSHKPAEILKEQRYMLASIAVCALSSLALNILLPAYFGFHAVAYIQSTSLALYILLMKRKFSINLYPGHKFTFCAIAAMLFLYATETYTSEAWISLATKFSVTIILLLYTTICARSLFSNQNKF